MHIRPLVRRLAAVALVVSSVALFPVGCAPEAKAPGTLALPGFAPPLNDAQVGEELVLRRGEQEWRYTVVEAGDTNVRVQALTYENGEPTDRPKLIEWHRNGFGVPQDAVIRRIERGRVETGGRSWVCWILHVYTRDRGRYIYWISDQVAVHGILKMAKMGDQGVDEQNAIVWVSDTLSGK